MYFKEDTDMSFLNDLKINAGAALSKVGTAANQTAALARVKMDLVGINRTLKGKYAVLGRRVYHTGLENVMEDGSIIELVEEIKTLRAKRKELDLEVAQLKDIAVCTECGSENPKQVSNCMKCGQRLHD